MTLNKIMDKNKLQTISYATINDKNINKIHLGNNKGSTIFDIASLTKLFTTTRILQIMENNKLNLDDKIYSYLPSFKEKKISIRDCLIHKTGFKPSLSGRYTLNRSQIIDSIMNGEDFIESNYNSTQYSCINFVILGLLIETLDQMTLVKSFKQFIFDPLHMNNTSFNPKQKNLCAPTELNNNRGLIQGEVHDQTCLAMGGISGNAGLFSSLDDMLLFTQAIMDHRILKKNTIDLLFKTNINKRSLGWNIFKSNVLYHTGFTGPVIVYDRENEKALILLTNRTYPNRNNNDFLELRNELIEEFLRQ